jgi:hypothetical protein
MVLLPVILGFLLQDIRRGVREVAGCMVYTLYRGDSYE